MIHFILEVYHTVDHQIFFRYGRDFLPTNCVDYDEHDFYTHLSSFLLLSNNRAAMLAQAWEYFAIQRHIWLLLKYFARIIPLFQSL